MCNNSKSYIYMKQWELHYKNTIYRKYFHFMLFLTPINYSWNLSTFCIVFNIHMKQPQNHLFRGNYKNEK